MRILVTGGRDYSDREAVWSTLDSYRKRYGRLTIIQGGARGADALAREWAYKQNSVHLINVPANWDEHGSSAGPIRNRVMLEEYRPDIVLAFPGGRGTAHMVRIASKAGVRIVQSDAALSATA